MYTLKKIKIDNINALSYDGSTFWRDEQLKKSKGLEYSMMTSGDKMKARMDKLKIGTTATRPVPFGFGDKAGNGAGASLQVNVSDSRAVTFVYDLSLIHICLEGRFLPGICQERPAVVG